MGLLFFGCWFLLASAIVGIVVWTILQRILLMVMGLFGIHMEKSYRDGRRVWIQVE